ncbi:hypothetical protein PsYK624_139120 [Phanerochaete sordida]|uniref:F-box domain-containing protein n=1 Tax=Phanerochaete sordida TaxID=48140 RepID=A0A9P3LJM9_9APHY|nr:hypothetical protein PsYK624_139120 [Phanerochaete sordida]
MSSKALPLAVVAGIARELATPPNTTDPSGSRGTLQADRDSDSQGEEAEDEYGGEDDEETREAILHRESRAALAVCSLVCSEWKKAAQPLLFREMRVHIQHDKGGPGTQTKTWAGFLKLLEQPRSALLHTLELDISYEAKGRNAPVKKMTLWDQTILQKRAGKDAALLPVDLRELRLIAEACSKIRSVTLQYLDIRTSAEHAAFKFPSTLQDVDIIDSTIAISASETTSCDMSSFLAPFVGVRSLRFEGVPFSDCTPSLRPNALPVFENLQELSFDNCDHIHALLQILPVVASQCFPRLKTLALGTITPDDIVSVRDVIQAFAAQLSDLTLAFEFSSFELKWKPRLNLKKCAVLHTLRLAVEGTQRKGRDPEDTWAQLSRFLSNLASAEPADSPPLERIVIEYGRADDTYAPDDENVDLDFRALERLQRALLKFPALQRVVFRPPSASGYDRFGAYDQMHIASRLPELVWSGMLAFEVSEHDWTPASYPQCILDAVHEAESNY